MPILEIQGRKVELGADFARMTQEQQDSVVEDVVHDIELRANAEKNQSYLGGVVDQFTDGVTFGFGDNLTALEAGVLGKTPDGQWFNYDESFGKRYDDALKAERYQMDKFAERNPGTAIAAQVAGGLSSGIGAAKSGLTLMKAGQTLPKMAGAGLVEGAAYGALSGTGNANGEDLVGGALKGAALGGMVGGIAPAAIKAAGTGLKTVGGVFGIGNEQRAKGALAEALTRSGKSLDDVAGELAEAAADGQDEFALADALGTSGQRMLSGITRSPGEARQMVTDRLLTRQAGQSDRLVNALTEGFDATETAAQRAARLTEQRGAQAGADYAQVRQGARPVNTSQAIQRADDFLDPGMSKTFDPRDNIADDSVESAVRRARAYLTDGRSILFDFGAAHRSKIELDNMIERATPAVKNRLIPIRNALDSALEDASPNYAKARDAYRQASKEIEAVETGKMAATRGRADDNIPRFNSMSEGERRAFRGGYADPLIERVERASSSPTTNKARALITAKTGREFPAFAVPSQAPRLTRRIAREDQMFQTANQALGGSKTADNLADIADVQAFDPTMIGAIASGNIKNAVIQSLVKSSNLLTGQNQKTRDIIASILLETDGSAIAQQLAGAVKRGDVLSQAEMALVRSLAMKAGATGGQLEGF